MGTFYWLEGLRDTYDARRGCRGDDTEDGEGVEKGEGTGGGGEGREGQGVEGPVVDKSRRES